MDHAADLARHAFVMLAIESKQIVESMESGQELHSRAPALVLLNNLWPVALQSSEDRIIVRVDRLRFGAVVLAEGMIGFGFGQPASAIETPPAEHTTFKLVERKLIRLPAILAHAAAEALPRSLPSVHETGTASHAASVHDQSQ